MLQVLSGILKDGSKHPHWWSRVPEVNYRVKTFGLVLSLWRCDHENLVKQRGDLRVISQGVQELLGQGFRLSPVSPWGVRTDTKPRGKTSKNHFSSSGPSSRRDSCLKSLPFYFLGRSFFSPVIQQRFVRFHFDDLNKWSERVWLILAFNKWSDLCKLHSQQARRVIHGHLGTMTSSTGTAGSWREHLLSISASLVLNSWRSAASRAQIEL